MTRFFTSLILACATTFVFGQNPTTLLQQAEAMLSGSRSAAEVSIRTVRPRWERTMDAKIWNEGMDKTMILITGPAREKGTVFLRNGDDVWHYVPGIKKVVALPAAMVQSWMGTDFTNDALINAGSLVEDYTHKLKGIVSIDGTPCYQIELVPKPEAPVVWGKVITHISVKQTLQLRTEFYDEDDYLVTTLKGTDIRDLGGQMLPSKLTIIPADEEGFYTEMTYKRLDFNPTFAPDFFERSNMKQLQ